MQCQRITRDVSQHGSRVDCLQLGWFKASPLGDGFSYERRRISWEDERVPTWRAHRIRDPLAHRMVDEVPQAGADWRSSIESTGDRAGDLRGARYQNHEGACVERSRASAGVDTAASNDQPNAAMAEGEDGLQNNDGVSAYEKALLGATHVGARIFLLQHRKCDG